jgi:hypothetical protein
MKTFVLAMSLCSLTACAIDEPDDDTITTATDEQSITAALTKVPGRPKQEIIEIPMLVDHGDEVSLADVIACTLNAQGWYAGSGHNFADAFVLCPVIEDAIAITFYWFSHNTGAIMRTSPKLACFDKSSCGKSDGFDSFAVLDVIVCATTIKAGYLPGSNCTHIGPF